MIFYDFLRIGNGVASTKKRMYISKRSFFWGGYVPNMKQSSNTVVPQNTNATIKSHFLYTKMVRTFENRILSKN